MSAPERPRFRSSLFVVLLTVFVDLVGFGVIVPLLPFYTDLFGGGPAVLGFLIASFFLMQFLTAPIFGRLSDRIGRRPVLLATLGLATLSYVILAAATSLAVLFLARILSGIASGNLAVAQAYVADRTLPEGRARGMGLIGAAFGVGFAVGPVIGGTLSPFGLSMPALAAAAIAAANLVLAIVFLPESISVKRPVATGLGWRRPGSMAEGFRRPTIRALLATFFVVSFSFSAVPVAYPSLGIAYFGMGPRELSLIFILIGAITIAVGSALGRLARRLGEERLVALGAASMTAALAATPFIRDLAAYVALTGLMSFGVAITIPLVPALVSKRSSSAEQGSMLGLTQSIGSLGRIPGPVIAGILFQGVGVAAPFVLASLLMLLGFLLSVQVYRESVRLAAAHAIRDAEGANGPT